MLFCVPMARLSIGNMWHEKNIWFLRADQLEAKGGLLVCQWNTCHWAAWRRNIRESPNHRWDANCLSAAQQSTPCSFDPAERAGASLLKSVERRLAGASHQRNEGEPPLWVSLSSLVSTLPTSPILHTQGQVVVCVWTRRRSAPGVRISEKNEESSPTNRSGCTWRLCFNPSEGFHLGFGLYPRLFATVCCSAHSGNGWRRQIETQVAAWSGSLMEPNGLMCSPSSAYSLSSYPNWLHARVSFQLAEGWQLILVLEGFHLNQYLTAAALHFFWGAEWKRAAERRVAWKGCHHNSVL